MAVFFGAQDFIFETFECICPRVSWWLYAFTPIILDKATCSTITFSDFAYFFTRLCKRLTNDIIMNCACINSCSRNIMAIVQFVVYLSFSNIFENICAYVYTTWHVHTTYRPRICLRTKRPWRSLYVFRITPLNPRGISQSPNQNAADVNPYDPRRPKYVRDQNQSTPNHTNHIGDILNAMKHANLDAKVPQSRHLDTSRSTLTIKPQGRHQVK